MTGVDVLRLSISAERRAVTRKTPANHARLHLSHTPLVHLYLIHQGLRGLFLKTSPMSYRNNTNVPYDLTLLSSVPNPTQAGKRVVRSPIFHPAPFSRLAI
jgi:hypothetical protein